MHKQPEYMARALKHYGVVLREMNKELLKHSQPSTGLLKSAITLEIFQLLAFGSQTGWMKYAGGVGKLMQLLGPERFQKKEDRYLLEVNRVVIMMNSILSRQRCFLGEEKWRTIPVWLACIPLILKFPPLMPGPWTFLREI